MTGLDLFPPSHLSDNHLTTYVVLKGGVREGVVAPGWDDRGRSKGPRLAETGNLRGVGISCNSFEVQDRKPEELSPTTMVWDSRTLDKDK